MATAIRDIAAGEVANVGVDDGAVTVTVSETIGAGHKLALRQIAKGEGILKYGTVIGRATQDIAPGDQVMDGDELLRLSAAKA